MPTASANIKAKFIAQIVIPVNRLATQSAPAAGDEAEDREQQRDAGRRNRAERDQQHRQRERPRRDLGAEHRRLVLVVELRPQRGRPGQRHLNVALGRSVEALLDPARGADHLCRVGAGAALHDRDVAVRRDRLARARKLHPGDSRIAPQHRRGCRDRAPEGGIARGVPS